MIDLATLPPPDVLELLDYEDIYQRLLARFVTLYPEYDAVLESDPVIKLLELAAYNELLIRQRINDAASANILAFAQGADLDALAAFYELERIAGEEDGRFKRRLQLRIRSLGAMGTVDYYCGRALSAGLWVKDVAVIASRGSLIVTVLLADDCPDDALERLHILINDPAARMATDHLVVQQAVPLPVSVRAELRRLPGVPLKLLDDAKAALVSQLAPLGLGATVRRSWLSAKLMIDGIGDVALRSPASDVVCQSHEYPVITLDVVEAAA